MKGLYVNVMYVREMIHEITTLDWYKLPRMIKMISRHQREVRGKNDERSTIELQVNVVRINNNTTRKHNEDLQSNSQENMTRIYNRITGKHDNELQANIKSTQCGFAIEFTETTTDTNENIK